MADVLTLAKLRAAKEILERHSAPTSDHAWMTAGQWAALGGHPDIFDTLPEVDGLPGYRAISASGQ